ncbi:MAG TPA: hypothetical protein VGW33_05205 [Terriglobia bacterium]|nr:hypothetical protein [Terriglobia bacterium]
MSASLKQLQEMDVINYVYRLSQVVKRLDNGRAVSRDELDRVLEQQYEMGAAALDLQDKYPELPGICERMYLRLSALVGEAEPPRRWTMDSPAHAHAQAK